MQIRSQSIRQVSACMSRQRGEFVQEFGMIFLKNDTPLNKAIRVSTQRRRGAKMQGGGWRSKSMWLNRHF